MKQKFLKHLQFSLLVLTGLSFHRAHSQPAECAPEAMSKCTDPLKVVTDNKDLGFATSLQELEEMCPKLMEGLHCIDDFTLKCLDREHRAYFNTLYAGTTQVIIDLCQEGKYQKDYLTHAPCMRNVQNGYEKCAAEYQVRIKSLNEKSQREDQAQPKVTYDYYDASTADAEAAAGPYAYDEYDGKNETAVAGEQGHQAVPAEQKPPVPNKKTRRQAPTAVGETSSDDEAAGHEYAVYEDASEADENVRLLCCSFQRYLHCSESVVNTTCGYETAKFTKSFLDRMSGPLIQGHCQAYELTADMCDHHESKFPWAETNNDSKHVSHYSKTDSPYSTGTSITGSAAVILLSSVIASFRLILN